MAKKMRFKNKKNDVVFQVDKRVENNVNRKNVERAKPGLVRIEFPVQGFLWLIGIGLVFVLYEKLLGVLIILFFSFILTSTILPVYKSLLKKNVPRGIALFLVYFVLILGIAVVVGGVLIPTIAELQQLIRNLPELVESTAEAVNSLNVPVLDFGEDALHDLLLGYSRDLSADIIPALMQGYEGVAVALQTLFEVVGGGVIAVLTVLVLSAYSIIEHEYMVNSIILRFVEKRNSVRVRKLIADIENKLGRWLVGQVTLSVLVGLLSWILLTIIGVPFALPLALIAALLESVPNLGPLFAAVPAMLLAFVHGGLSEVAFVVVSYIFIQQLENNIIVPKVLGNAVGLRPIVVLIGIMVGFAVGNVVGALLAVPILVISKLGVEFYFDLQKLRVKGNL